jgi:hypothetical protein
MIATRVSCGFDDMTISFDIRLLMAHQTAAVHTRAPGTFVAQAICLGLPRAAADD